MEKEEKQSLDQMFGQLEEVIGILGAGTNGSGNVEGHINLTSLKGSQLGILIRHYLIGNLNIQGER